MTGLTVWHDGGCPLCRREIALLRRLDRRGAIEFVDARRSEVCPVDRRALLACFDGGRMIPQPGGFHGGWTSSGLAGPFKGVPGSRF